MSCPTDAQLRALQEIGEGNVYWSLRSLSYRSAFPQRVRTDVVQRVVNEGWAEIKPPQGSMRWVGLTGAGERLVEAA